MLTFRYVEVAFYYRYVETLTIYTLYSNGVTSLENGAYSVTVSPVIDTESYPLPHPILVAN